MLSFLLGGLKRGTIDFSSHFHFSLIFISGASESRVSNAQVRKKYSFFSRLQIFDPDFVYCRVRNGGAQKMLGENLGLVRKKPGAKPEHNSKLKLHFIVCFANF